MNTPSSAKNYTQGTLEALHYYLCNCCRSRGTLCFALHHLARPDDQYISLVDLEASVRNGRKLVPDHQIHVHFVFALYLLYGLALEVAPLAHHDLADLLHVLEAL